jgi:hypothetical protein
MANLPKFHDDLHTAVLDVTLAYLKGLEAESEAQEYANSSSLTLYASPRRKGILASEWGNPRSGSVTRG